MLVENVRVYIIPRFAKLLHQLYNVIVAAEHQNRVDLACAMNHAVKHEFIADRVGTVPPLYFNPPIAQVSLIALLC
jgi:hypothetical protein